MKKITLAIALSMSLAAGSAQAADNAPSGSNNDEKVLIGAALIGLAIWLLAGKDKDGMSTSSKNAESGTGSGKVLEEF